MDVDVLDLGTDLDVEAEFSLVERDQSEPGGSVSVQGIGVRVPLDRIPVKKRKIDNLCSKKGKGEHRIIDNSFQFRTSNDFFPSARQNSLLLFYLPHTVLE